LLSLVCQRFRPVLRSRATIRGACGSATGTYTVRPAIATVPLMGLPVSYCQSCLPVVAFSAKTNPPFDPATSTFLSTTGVAVKSPWWEWKLHAGPRFGTCAAVGPFTPPLRELPRSWP
jgi:hypothetical protein